MNDYWFLFVCMILVILFLVFLVIFTVSNIVCITILDLDNSVFTLTDKCILSSGYCFVYTETYYRYFLWFPIECSSTSKIFVSEDVYSMFSVGDDLQIFDGAILIGK